MATQFIPFGPFSPDVSFYQNPSGGLAGVSHTVQNVVPTNVSPGQIYPQVTYGPLPSVSTFTNALNAPCQGAISLYSANNTGYMFAGDIHDLYQLNGTSTNWANVSSTAGTYDTPGVGFWSFANYSDTIIATNFADPIQAFSVGPSTKFATLSSTAPKAKYIAVVKDFVVVGFTSDPASGTRPQRVWWSAVGDPTNWPTPGSVTAIELQSDFNEIPGDHGQITAIVPNVGKADCTIFFERGIWTMSYVGGGDIFDFFPATGSQGTYAPKSIVVVNDVAFYLGADGFYKFDGSESIPIGFDKVDKYFFSQVSPALIQSTVGVADPISHNIIWTYCGSGNSGIPNKAIIYNWALDAWSSAVFTSEYVFQTVSFGKTLEQIGALYPTLEDVPYSFDSPVWQGGTAQVLGGFDGTHSLGYMNGTPLIPIIDTAQFSCGGGQISSDQRGVITLTRPIYDGTTFVPTVSIATTETNATPATYMPPVPMNLNGGCPQRTSGRYFIARLSSDTPNPFSQLDGIEVEFTLVGRR